MWEERIGRVQINREEVPGGWRRYMAASRRWWPGWRRLKAPCGRFRSRSRRWWMGGRHKGEDMNRGFFGQMSQVAAKAKV